MRLSEATSCTLFSFDDPQLECEYSTQPFTCAANKYARHAFTAASPSMQRQDTEATKMHAAPTWRRERLAPRTQVGAVDSCPQSPCRGSTGCRSFCTTTCQPCRSLLAEFMPLGCLFAESTSGSCEICTCSHSARLQGLRTSRKPKPVHTARAPRPSGPASRAGRDLSTVRVHSAPQRRLAQRPSHSDGAHEVSPLHLVEQPTGRHHAILHKGELCAQARPVSEHR